MFFFFDIKIYYSLIITCVMQILTFTTSYILFHPQVPTITMLLVL
jgi:hypothetical protein